MYTVPIILDENVTANKTMSTGVVKQRMYFTESLKTSEKRNIAGC